MCGCMCECECMCVGVPIKVLIKNKSVSAFQLLFMRLEFPTRICSNGSLCKYFRYTWPLVSPLLNFFIFDVYCGINKAAWQAKIANWTKSVVTDLQVFVADRKFLWQKRGSNTK